MLEAIRQIGNFIIENNISLSTPTKRSANQYVFFVNVFLASTQNFQIEVEDFQICMLEKYLGEEEYSKGNDSRPFSPVTDFKKTLTKKVATWFKSFAKDNPSSNYARVSNLLEKNKDEIIGKLEKKKSELNLTRRDSKFLGIKIDNKYCGEIQEINYYWLRRKSKEDWVDGVCSICGEETKVTARTGVFKFDTFDKPGFIAGGFSESQKWKNIPVCALCRASLSKGKKFSEQKLSYKFYGFNYLLIPNVFSNNKEIVKEVLEILGDETKVKDIRLKYLKDFISDEKEIKAFLSGEFVTDKLPTFFTNDSRESFTFLKDLISSEQSKDTITYNFLFIRKDNAAERILLLIEDILPSRLSDIYSAKVDTERLFKELIFDNKNESDFWDKYSKYFNFGKIRNFFLKSDQEKKNTDLDNYFLAIIDSIFRGEKISWNFLTKFYSQSISNAFINDNFFRYRVTDAMMITNFLQLLNLLTFNQEDIMTNSIFEEIFEKLGKSLNTPTKRGIFLLGALAEMLLRLQYHLRGSTPFMKKLKSLKMREEDIKSLLPEIQNKFIEYDSFGLRKRKLAEEISQFLLESGENWTMSVDEINYYFACGMNLCEKVKELLEKYYPQSLEE